MSGTLFFILAGTAGALVVVARWYLLPWVSHEMCSGLGCVLCGGRGKRLRLGSRLLYKALNRKAP